MRLLLASASPRRRDLLEAAGFACDVEPMDVDERPFAAEPALAYVDRLARTKAAAGAARHPHRVVLGADTVVVVDEDILGKPTDTVEAHAMLRRIRGRAHDVLTGVAIAARGQLVSHVERTTVWFTDVSDVDITWYVETGEPMDKAGAYAIQGLASRFVTRIDGSYTNVVGLPVATVVGLLEQLTRET
jgi:septum formation protein